MDKTQRAYDELNIEIRSIRDKIREMLECGRITPNMLDFEFYNEAPMNIGYVAKFPDFDENIESEVEVEISIIVRKT